MQKYSKVFFAVLLAHTLKSALIFSPVCATELEIDKDSKTDSRVVVNHFYKDRGGYKIYTYEKEEKSYLNVTKVFFGERELLPGGVSLACNYVFYARVIWKGDVAPVMLKFKYYDWFWNTKRLHYVLNAQLEWEKVTVEPSGIQDEAEYTKFFKNRMDEFTKVLTPEQLATYKPFKDTMREQRPAGKTEEEKADKKKYVLMVVVVVVFVVVASLVVFLVKFCLK